jgi:acyl CoA:acetate/3-ketoacid CoA transferase
VERDIGSKVGFSLQVSPECKPMDARVFKVESMGLAAEWA